MKIKERFWQASRVWYIKIHMFLIDLGMVQKHGLIMIVLIYVDDLLITGNHANRIDALENKLENRFEMSKLGLLTFYIGVEFCPEATLMEGVKLHTNREADSVEIGNYQRFIGTHLDAATSILRYIRGTSNFGVFSRTTSIDLQGFVDSDWGRDLDKRRSTSSLLHKVGEVPLHWSNKLQPIVVLSTTETEYNALSDGAIEIMSLRTMMIELGEGPMQPTKVFCDNQSSIKVVKNLVLHARTKHIELQHHYIRERVEEGDIKVTNIHTRVIFQQFRQRIGIFNLEEFSECASH
uniref:Reverse transcriptase Ty1/copia-type domain-containing protein n=1 Tax=Physcomitrium patens TaxID=3218 RepID=A0A2K1ICZ5_PHYPA|nr:hypothetical protein PHYPA_030631 [Physcomitrium patens]